MVDTDRDAGANARTAGVVAVAVVLVAAQAGLVAFAAGVGPFDRSSPGPGAAAPSEPAVSGERTGNAGGSKESGEGTGGSGTDGASEPPPYDLAVLGTERCGNTCRDVTVRLTNNRNATAEEIAVRTRIYAGNTTADRSPVWEGRNEVGTLAAGASTTATARVSLSYVEAITVQRRGGWVTIVTTVESTDLKETFRERRQVT